MKAERKHPITQKYPIIAIVALIMACIVIEGIVGILMSALGLMKVFGSDTGGYIASVLGSIVFLVFMKFWYAPKYQGAFQSGLSNRLTLIAMTPMILYSLFFLIYNLISFHFYFDGSFANITQALAAGFGEEVMFRATIIPIAMGFLKSEKRVWLVPIITGLIFGAMHLGNAGEGAGMTNAIVQAIVTAMVGFYFGALYVSTGSVMPGVIMHSIYDFICFSTDKSLTNGIMTSTLPMHEIVINIVVGALLVGGAVWVMKSLGDRNTLKLWKKKWSQ